MCEYYRLHVLNEMLLVSSVCLLAFMVVIRHLQKNVAESWDLQVLKYRLYFECLIFIVRLYIFAWNSLFKPLALDLGLQTVRFDVFLLKLIDLRNLFIIRLVINSDPHVIKHIHIYVYNLLWNSSLMRKNP